MNTLMERWIYFLRNWQYIDIVQCTRLDIHCINTGHHWKPGHDHRYIHSNQGDTTVTLLSWPLIFWWSIRSMLKQSNHLEGVTVVNLIIMTSCMSHWAVSVFWTLCHPEKWSRNYDIFKVLLVHTSNLEHKINDSCSTIDYKLYYLYLYEQLGQLAMLSKLQNSY